MARGTSKTLTFYEIIKNSIKKYDDKFFIYTTVDNLSIPNILQKIIEFIYEDNLDIDIIINGYKIFSIEIEKIKNNIKKKISPNEKHFNHFFEFKKKNNIKIVTEKNINIVLKDITLVKKNILIITTYDSIKIIIDFITKFNKINQKDKIIPDLLICDEAANLLNHDYLNIAKIILDENANNIFFIPKKFLFMTSSPLMLNRINNNKCFTTNKSFGKVFFEYSFSMIFNDYISKLLY